MYSSRFVTRLLCFIIIEINENFPHLKDDRGEHKYVIKLHIYVYI